METKNEIRTKWWYPDAFYIEAFKVVLVGFVLQILFVILIGVPNVIFKWTWIRYFSWLLVVNYLIVQSVVLIILIKGLWRKIKE